MNVSLSRPLHLLTVAALDWRCGHEYTLEALAVLASRGVAFEYQLVGRGKFTEAAAFAAHELGLDQQVQFILEPPSAELDGYLAWADGFVLSAVAPVADAMDVQPIRQAVRCHLPVIVSDVLFQELGADLSGCQIVPRRNVPALAEALSQIKLRRQDAG